MSTIPPPAPDAATAPELTIAGRTHTIRSSKAYCPGGYDDLARLLEEQDTNALGTNVIWVDSYDQIPTIIRSLR